MSIGPNRIPRTSLRSQAARLVSPERLPKEGSSLVEEGNISGAGHRAPRGKAAWMNGFGPWNASCSIAVTGVGAAGAEQTRRNRGRRRSTGNGDDGAGVGGDGRVHGLGRSHLPRGVLADARVSGRQGRGRRG